MMVCGLVCVFRAHLSEPSDGEKASATSYSYGCKITKFKVQVKSRIGKISRFWMLGSPH